MNPDELKKRTKEFAHRCVKIDEKLMKKEKVLPLLSEAHELASIFIVTRKTAQSRKQRQINNRQSPIDNPKAIANRQSKGNRQSTIQRQSPINNPNAINNLKRK